MLSFRRFLLLLFFAIFDLPLTIIVLIVSILYGMISLNMRYAMHSCSERIGEMFMARRKLWDRI